MLTNAKIYPQKQNFQNYLRPIKIVYKKIHVYVKTHENILLNKEIRRF